MYIRLYNNTEFNINSLMGEILKAARKYILFCRLDNEERKLDKYLAKNYKLNLKLACLKIINNIKFNTDNKHYIIITFNSRVDESIAKLITYGNSEFFGSKILIKALTVLNRR